MKFYRFLPVALLVCLMVLVNAPFSYAQTGVSKEVATLYFGKNPTEKMDENYIRVNGERLIPPFDFQNTEYNAISLNTLRPIEISVGSMVQTVQLDELSPDQYISVNISGKVYKIFTAMSGMPSYQFESVPGYKGDLYVTPSSMQLEVPSYAYIIDESGKLVFYRANETPPWTLANFNKHVLKDGKIRYSLFRQFNNMTPLAYFFGEEIILDENFKVIDRLQVLPYKNREKNPVENHAFLMIDDNHYIVTGYYFATVKGLPWENKNVLGAIIQEIKDGKVVFDWMSTDHVELYATCIEGCHFKAAKTYQDYLHLNTVVLDPVDNNLIVSMAASSQILKIDHVSGKVLWKLGGIKSDFKLEKNQYFLRQHDVQITKDGWLIMLDNRYPAAAAAKRIQDTDFTMQNPYKARIVAFKLNEENQTVTDFKEFPLDKAVYFMGSVQPVENERLLIGYGSNRGIAAQELDFQNTVYMSLAFNNPYTSYKVYKYER